MPFSQGDLAKLRVAAARLNEIKARVEEFIRVNTALLALDGVSDSDAERLQNAIHGYTSFTAHLEVALSLIDETLRGVANESLERVLKMCGALG